MFRFLNWYGLPRIHVYAFSTVVADPIGDIINRVASILLCSPLEIREGISKLSDEGIDDKAVNKHYCEGYIVRGKDKYFNGRGHNDDDDDDDDDDNDDDDSDDSDHDNDGGGGSKMVPTSFYVIITDSSLISYTCRL